MDHLATQWNLMFPPANKFVLAVGLWPVLFYEYARTRYARPANCYCSGRFPLINLHFAMDLSFTHS